MKKAYLYPTERLVFEREGWGIIIDDEFNSHEGAHYAYIYATHQECTVSYTGEDEEPDNGRWYGDYCWSLKCTDTLCELCEEPVPAGIQALVLLQNWEQ